LSEAAISAQQIDISDLFRTSFHYWRALVYQLD